MRKSKLTSSQSNTIYPRVSANYVVWMVGKQNESCCVNAVLIEMISNDEIKTVAFLVEYDIYVDVKINKSKLNFVRPLSWNNFS